MRRSEGKYTSKRREIERMNTVKNELISFLNDDTDAASLLGYSVCRNSSILDDVCGDTDVNRCKEMVNELIANVLTINYKFERVLVDALIRALKTSSSRSISSQERRSNFFNSVCKIIYSKCAEMIDSNMKKCSYIVNRYTDIDNEMMFDLFVYAIMVQYTYDINALHNNGKGGAKNYHLHFDKSDKVDSDLYDKTVLSNLERRINKRKHINIDNVTTETNSPELINTTGVIYLPESSKMLRHKTVINASDDDKQVGRYRPTENYSKPNFSNNESKGSGVGNHQSTNISKEEVLEDINNLLDNMKEVICGMDEVVELETIKIIFEGINAKKSREELIRCVCSELPHKFNIDHAIIGQYILFNTSMINAFYQLDDKDVNDIMYVNEVISVIDEIIHGLKNSKASSFSKNKEVKKDESKSTDNTSTEPKPGTVESSNNENKSNAGESKGTETNDKPKHKSTLEAWMSRTSEGNDKNKSNNTKTEGTKTNDKPKQKSTLESWMSRNNSNNYNGKFSKIVKEYKGTIDLSNVMDELVLELDSIGALDVIDNTLEKLQINMDELAYVLFALTNKNALSNRLRKEVYSVFIKNVIGNHKHKDRIMDVVVDTLLANKGTHSVTDLHPYTSDVKIEPLDETINLSMRMMKCKIEDLAC